MKSNIEKKTFVGRPFPDSMMDGQKTFTESNAQIENDQVFQKFLKDNNLENKRSSMVVFGPENFMYWYGVLVDPDKAQDLPAGLMKFDLPAAEVASVESDGAINAFDVPLNFVIPTFFKKLADKGIELYENPGDSNTPYLVQDLDLANNQLVQSWYLNEK